MVKTTGLIYHSTGIFSFRPERVQTDADQERDDHRAKFPSTELYRRQKYYQCRFAACGK